MSLSFVFVVFPNRFVVSIIGTSMLSIAYCAMIAYIATAAHPASTPAICAHEKKKLLRFL